MVKRFYAKLDENAYNNIRSHITMHAEYFDLTYLSTVVV